MTTQTMDRTIGEYVGRCTHHLRDLPEADRLSILDDIRQILTEVTAELEGTPDDLLGPPERFVDELRRAAGLQVTDQTPPGSRSKWVPLAEEALAAIRSHAAARWVRELAVELRPAWWVGRGFGLAGLLGEITSEDSWWWLAGAIPFPAVFGSRLAGFAAVIGLIVGSVRLGRSRIGLQRRFGLALTVALGLALFVAGASARSPYALESDPMTPVTHAFPEEAGTTGYEAPVIRIGTTEGEYAAFADVDDATGAYFDLTSRLAGTEIWVEIDGTRLHPQSEAEFLDLMQSMLSGYLR